MLFNLHTHTHFSDGSSAPEEYVKEAIRQGFSVLGFSDHSPVPFENNFAIKEERMDEYVNTIISLKDKYSQSIAVTFPLSPPLLKERWAKGEVDVIKILLGLEIDYIPGITKSIEEYRKINSFDYFIGSVHLVRNGNNPDLWFIDGQDISIYDAGLKDFFYGNIRYAVRSYYHQINLMIVTQKPDMIGHLDKIKMHNMNRYFQEDENWYVQLVDETLDLIRENHCVVEVNTRGIYKKRSDSLFPGPEILKKIKTMKIPVTISSDAHRPNELSFYFKETGKILMDIGFETISLKTETGWKNIPISDFLKSCILSNKGDL
jgi:histidinol-phosphatase (PHP family)